MTLSIEKVQESHTAENLKDSILSVIKSWDLNGKITGNTWKYHKMLKWVKIINQIISKNVL